MTTLHKSTAALSRWVCVVTLNNATEGKVRRTARALTADSRRAANTLRHSTLKIKALHGMAQFQASALPANPTDPLPVNPDLNKANIDNSYSAVILTHFGRIYAVSNANLDNVTSLPSGEHVTRTDGKYLAIATC